MGEGVAIGPGRGRAELLFAILLILVAAGFFRGSPPAFSAFNSDTDANGADAQAAMPFRAGEVLNYRLEWARIF